MVSYKTLQLLVINSPPSQCQLMGNSFSYKAASRYYFGIFKTLCLPQCEKCSKFHRNALKEGFNKIFLAVSKYLCEPACFVRKQDSLACKWFFTRIKPETIRVEASGKSGRALHQMILCSNTDCDSPPLPPLCPKASVGI